MPTTKNVRAAEFDSDLPFNDAFVLEGAIGLMLEEAIAPPTATEISDEIGLSRREVVESLKSLCKAKFVEWPPHGLRTLKVNFSRLSIATI